MKYLRVINDFARFTLATAREWYQLGLFLQALSPAQQTLEGDGHHLSCFPGQTCYGDRREEDGKGYSTVDPENTENTEKKDRFGNIFRNNSKYRKTKARPEADPHNPLKSTPYEKHRLREITERAKKYSKKKYKDAKDKLAGKDAVAWNRSLAHSKEALKQLQDEPLRGKIKRDRFVKWVMRGAGRPDARSISMTCTADDHILFTAENDNTGDILPHLIAGLKWADLPFQDFLTWESLKRRKDRDVLLKDSLVEPVEQRFAYLLNHVYATHEHPTKTEQVKKKADQNKGAIAKGAALAGDTVLTYVAPIWLIVGPPVKWVGKKVYKPIRKKVLELRGEDLQLRADEIKETAKLVKSHFLGAYKNHVRLHEKYTPPSFDDVTEQMDGNETVAVEIAQEGSWQSDNCQQSVQLLWSTYKFVYHYTELLNNLLPTLEFVDMLSQDVEKWRSYLFDQKPVGENDEGKSFPSQRFERFMEAIRACVAENPAWHKGHCQLASEEQKNNSRGNTPNSLDVGTKGKLSQYCYGATKPYARPPAAKRKRWWKKGKKEKKASDDNCSEYAIAKRCEELREELGGRAGSAGGGSSGSYHSPWINWTMIAQSKEEQEKIASSGEKELVRLEHRLPREPIYRWVELRKDQKEIQKPKRSCLQRLRDSPTGRKKT